MKRLRTEVERVVRPLVASEISKNRMREELLCHVTSLYDQELARCHDEEQATAAALARFGEPADLRRELQQAIPLAERVLWKQLPLRNWSKRRPGETIDGHLWRVIGVQIAFISVFMLLLTLFAVAMALTRRARPGEPLIGPLVAFMATSVIVHAVVSIVFPFACERLRHQFSRWQTSASPSWRSALAMAGTFTVNATVVAVGAGAMYAMLPSYLGISVTYPWAFEITVVGSALLSLPLTAIQSWQQEQRARQFADWDGSEPGAC